MKKTPWVILIVLILLAAMPTAQDSLAALMPTLNTDDCVNTSVSATTSTVVSSSLSTTTGYDFVSDASDCWYEFKASGSAADNTGRFLPQGVNVPGYPANARMVVYCSLATTVAVCPNVQSVQ